MLRLIDDDFEGNRIAILRSLTTLRLMSLHPHLADPKYPRESPSVKIDTLLDQLEEIAAEGHRALVFSQFTGYLALIRERLAERSIEYAYLDGGTRDRAARIAEFRSGTQPVFLISLKAGGFGLTLTEADYVFVMDPWWNPAAENQAVDRTHRIGQDKTVMVYRLVAANTIEEKVVALQERKRALFDQVVTGGALQSGVLTADDVRAVLGLEEATRSQGAGAGRKRTVKDTASAPSTRITGKPETRKRAASPGWAPGSSPDRNP